jgi:hypothetical protein
MPSGPNLQRAKPLLLLTVATCLVIHPLLVHGISCGHDLGFHVLSWLDAAQQLRHGTFYPHWTTTAAWNAGEPRFLFYPPLSWYAGALLTLVLPINAAPIAYIFLALLAAGLSFYKLARSFVSPNAALLAAALYLANPYMLFNAFERSALAELLAAAWIPLLLLAVLRKCPTVRGIAIPIALLWLTNAPAAVMGCYTFALLAALRITLRSCHPERSEGSALLDGPGTLSLALTYLAGTALGLALPAFYLLPAAWERRYVQVAMAIIPNMRFQDNFLFAHTADAAHNAVNHTATLLALTLLAVTVITISTCLLVRAPGSQRQTPRTAAAFLSVIPAGNLLLLLALLTAIITLLLVPISTPLWNHLPELAYLQFPWRLLSILAPILCLALALLFNNSLTTRTPPLRSTVYSLLSALALSLLAYHLYAQPCDPADTPTAIAHLLATGHGTAPTDEYTPTAADNDVLRTGNPGYWLAANPNAPAPNTVPTAAELNPSLDTDDTPIPLNQTLSTPAPRHVLIQTTAPRYLILNLRNYPNWEVTEADPSAMELHHPVRIPRDDGLIAIYLNHVDNYTIDIRWHRTWDQTLGLALSALALLALLGETWLTSRTSRQSP